MSSLSSWRSGRGTWRRSWRTRSGRGWWRTRSTQGTFVTITRLKFYLEITSDCIPISQESLHQQPRLPKPFRLLERQRGVKAAQLLPDEMRGLSLREPSGIILLEEVENNLLHPNYLSKEESGGEEKFEEEEEVNRGKVEENEDSPAVSSGQRKMKSPLRPRKVFKTHGCEARTKERKMGKSLSLLFLKGLAHGSIVGKPAYTRCHFLGVKFAEFYLPFPIKTV